MFENIDTSPNGVYLQYSGNIGPNFGIVINNGGAPVTNINGLAGPVINFIGGSSGFSFTTTPPATIALTSPLTTKGDIYTRDATIGTRLGVGSNGQVLTADSSASTGLKWSAGSSGVGSDFTGVFLLMGA